MLSFAEGEAELLGDGSSPGPAEDKQGPLCRRAPGPFRAPALPHELSFVLWGWCSLNKERGL